MIEASSIGPTKFDLQNFVRGKLSQYQPGRRVLGVIDKLGSLDKSIGLADPNIGNTAVTQLGVIGKEFQKLTKVLGSANSYSSRILNKLDDTLSTLSPEVVNHPMVQNFKSYLKSKPEKYIITELELNHWNRNIKNALHTDFPNTFYKPPVTTLKEREYQKAYKANKQKQSIQPTQPSQPTETSQALIPSILPRDRAIWAKSQTPSGTPTKTFLPVHDVPFLQKFEYFRNLEKKLHPDTIQSTLQRNPTNEEIDTYKNVRRAFEDWYKGQTKTYKEINAEPPKSINYRKKTLFLGKK